VKTRPPAKLNWYEARHSCGCCYSRLYFKSDRRAEAALNRAGYGKSLSITDDTGRTIENVDTFYGLDRIPRNDLLDES
jgi:hypothetical protein